MPRRIAAIALLLLSACQDKDRPPSATPHAATTPSADLTTHPSAPDAGVGSGGRENGGGRARTRGDSGADEDARRVSDAGRPPAAGDAGPSSGPVLKAERTIAGLRPLFRACYNTGLRSDPAMVGSVVLTVTINADGIVASSVASQIEGLDAEVIDCFERLIRTAHFPPPGISGSTLTLPIAFRRGTVTLSDAGDLPPYVDPAAGHAPAP